eukprot:TRINITY_DN103439_c0_g1_i1.p1 TRINITY_DN103439_c0_g1~~TRINITY_DN103439_c0_g1_i1.p1  ORF type:complete len:354 (-),score=64.37 TRINITY_DN103439_c0_g1_i1:89-1150(-)
MQQDEIVMAAKDASPGDDEVMIATEAAVDKNMSRAAPAEPPEITGILDCTPHVVLLGDSTLDNVRHLDLDAGEMSIEGQLSKRCAEKGWEFTLLARDGSTLDDVARQQIPFIPDEATHLVLSASGNNLLSLLNEMADSHWSLGSMVSSIGEGLPQVAESYRRLLQAMKSSGCHMACCTVYRPQFRHIFLRTLATLSLGVHNARIHQIAQELDISVIDMGVLFDCDEDFANPLELSTQGGAKVVENVMQFMRDHPTAGLPRHLSMGAAPSSRVPRRGPCLSVDPVARAFGLDVACCEARTRRKVYDAKKVPEDRERAEPTMVLSTVVREKSDRSETRSVGPADFSQAQERWRML